MKKKKEMRPKFSDQGVQKMLLEKKEKLNSLKRKLEVETALDHIRNLTMEMKESEELAGVIKVVFREAIRLGFGAKACDLVIFDEKTGGAEFWISGDLNNEVIFARIPRLRSKYYEGSFSAWQKRRKLRSVELKGRSCQLYMHEVIEKSEDSNMPDSIKELLLNLNSIYHTEAFTKHGLFRVASDGPLHRDEEAILKRFAKVFEQTYTRFLDLKKAEAQAREAQIEVALERVRARTMAMHSSEELLDAATVLFKQLKSLGLNLWTSGFVLLDQNKDESEFRVTTPEGEIEPPVFIPNTKDPVTKNMYQHWLEGDEYYMEEAWGRKLKSHYDYMLLLPKSGHIFQAVLDAGFDFPEWQQWHAAYFSHGYIMIITKEPYRDDGLLNRFAKVFEQTYTRFLDLQKAEAQAREAQIEAALERVRARSMAMHKSEELSDAAVLLYNELRGLGLTQYFNCGYVEVDETENKQYVWTSTFDGKRAGGHFIPLTGDPVFNERYEAWKQQVPVFHQIVSGKKLKKHIEFVRPVLPKQFEEQIRSSFPDPTVFYCCNFSKGYLHIITDSQFNENEEALLDRFTKVFEQTYTRFLDLQKAEAQAREAEIEVALERVRARSMAMHKSDELKEVVATMYEQMESLHLAMIGCEIILCDDENSRLQFWSSNVKQTLLPERYEIPRTTHPFFKELWDAWRKKTPQFVITLKGEKKKEFDQHIFQKTDFKKFPAKLKKYIRSRKIDVFTFATMKYGLLEAVDDAPLPGDQVSVLQRFAKVFEQTYTRFLDLKKAEAQAREAQIEAALERVRARALAMHDSFELEEVVRIMREQMGLLGQAQLETLAVHLYPEEGDDFESWYAIRSAHRKKGNVISGTTRFSKKDTAIARKMLSLYHSDKSEYKMENQGKMLDEWQDMVMDRIPGMKEDWGDHIPEYQYWYFADFSGGSFVLIPREEPNEEAKELLKRSASVFDLAYRRYLDLKKAEAQAREAQIEAALERVRSQTMAMHKTDELREVINVVFEQFNVLDIKLDSAYINIFEEDNYDWNMWIASGGAAYPQRITIPYTNLPDFTRLRKARKSGEVFYTQIIGKKEKNGFFAHFFKHAKNIKVPKKRLKMIYEAAGSSISVTLSEHAAIAISNYNQNLHSEEENQILQRIGKVFEQTYTRFLDLRKAEIQAREAKIEAALERIRAKALAMQSSSDLLDVSIVLREQMGFLGQQELESSIIQLYNSPETLEAWYTFRSSETNSSKVVTDKAIIPVNSCDYIKETIEKYNSKETEYTIVSNGKKLADWYNVMVKVAPDTIEYDDRGTMKVPEILYYHYSKFTGGALLMISNEKPSEPSKVLQRRAAKVFNLAYQRFLDFQQAEERARESMKQASLDRVRAEIASMRTTDDLNRITPIVWKELTILGVPFFRCGVFIVDDNVKKVNVYLSNPEGESLAAWRSDYDTTPLFKATVESWKKQAVYKTEWNKDQFIEFSRTLIEQGLVENQQRYQAGMDVPDYLALQMIPFKQGMLYVGSDEKLNDDQIELVQALAESFSVAYARYEDFKQLEEAKGRIENTLIELKSTQSQLIHSEKMASLGELTAGIAHEIQNPLNFVNNFSDVNKELAEELLDEIKKGNGQEAEAIIKDIIDNEEKILHHGQRADGIVKGMLEHSRTGERVKEPTDINLLADEYLRLAYHGLRAKDKSFNADFKTELDESLPKINVVPQDIGRVLLNLINNAFYAVNKKAKENADSFHPEVVVSTKKLDGQVLISVSDNGPGIPEQLRDKIFQPFFTTKPTGQGSGLGLSLSYDIVKAHGGKVNVMTKQNEGTEFTIVLEVKNN